MSGQFSFLNDDAQDTDAAPGNVHGVAQHQPDGVSRHVARHVVVDAPSGQDDLRVVAHFLGLMGR